MKTYQSASMLVRAYLADSQFEKDPASNLEAGDDPSQRPAPLLNGYILGTGTR